MKVFIEVVSGNWAWEEKLCPKNSKSKRGLKAPAQTRYFNILRKVSPGDLLLTHLTTRLTSRREWQSSIVGISLISSNYYKRSKTLYIDTVKDQELPKPIKYSEYKNNENLSELFRDSIKINMQRYIVPITFDDLEVLMKLHGENYNFLRNSEYCKILTPYNIFEDRI